MSEIGRDRSDRDTAGPMTFIESSWTYDELGRIESQVVQKGPGPTQVVRQDLSYFGNDDPRSTAAAAASSAPRTPRRSPRCRRAPRSSRAAWNTPVNATRIHQGIGPMNPNTELFSAGDCPVCSDSGSLLAVSSIATGSLVLFCPLCETAWDQRPTEGRVDQVLSLQEVASKGISPAKEARSKARHLDPSSKW
jgi:hypothetical protein